MTSHPIIFNGQADPDNVVFYCTRCTHLALGPSGKTLCYVCEEAMESEDMTPAKIRALVGRDDANILEIGANDGSDTLQFIEAFPAGRIMCFECDPRCIKAWRTAVNDPRAQLIEMAVADMPGKRLFYPSGGKPPDKKWSHVESWDKSGSLLRDDKHTKDVEWLTFGEPFSVEVTTLDEFMGLNRTRIDLIWLDVQGAEAMVLRGGQRVMEEVEWVYLECHPKPFYHGQATFVELVTLLPGFVLHSKWAGDNYLFRRASP